MLVHYFDGDGFYTHSWELPINPVSGRPFDHNPKVCTQTTPLTLPPMLFNRWVGTAWVAVALPQPN